MDWVPLSCFYFVEFLKVYWKVRDLISVHPELSCNSWAFLHTITTRLYSGAKKESDAAMEASILNELIKSFTLLYFINLNTKQS